MRARLELFRIGDRKTRKHPQLQNRNRLLPMNARLLVRPQPQFDRLSPLRPSVSIPVEVCETDSTLELRSLLPGVEPQDLDLEVTKNRVTLSATVTYGNLQQPRRELRNGHRVYTELHARSHRRSIDLPVEVLPHRATATLRDGLLSVTLPKVPPSQNVKVSLSDLRPSQIDRPTPSPAATTPEDAELSQDLWSDA